MARSTKPRLTGSIRQVGAAYLGLSLALLPSGWAQRLPESGPKSRSEIRADRTRPLHRINSTHSVVARANPVGLAYFGRLSYQLRLFESDSPVLKDNFIGVGVAPAVTPAYARIGALVEVQPLTVLQLWATYEVVSYYGSLQFFQSFPGVTSAHDDSTLNDLADLPDDDDRRPYGTTGTQLTLGSRLQAKVGPVAARNLTRLSYADFDLRSGDTTFYDPTFDLLVPDEAWFLVNDLDVLWVTELGLTVGARWTMTHGFYETRHYAGADPGNNPNTPHHRLGPLVAYTFWDDQGLSKFDKPTVLLIVNWWLEHRYRTGADVSQGVPYVLLGFTFTGDLLAPN